MKKKAIIKLLIGLCTASLVLGVGACTNNEGTGISGPTATQPDRVVTEAYLSDKSISLLTGETHTLKLGNATAKEWKTSNATIVTVKDGVLEAKAEGLAFVTVTSERDETLTCMVSVSDSLGVPNISLSAQKRTLGISDVFTLSATPSVDGVQLSETVEWSVSDNTVAEITKNGNIVTIRALKAGTAQIGASLDGASALFELTVRAVADMAGAFTETPDSMTDAPITQASYYTGVSVDTVQTGESSVVYPTSYYGKYTDNAEKETQALVLFGTLTGEDRTIEWKNTGRFAYGFMLETIYTQSTTTSAYVDQDMIYYATEGADADGNYGMFISDLPEGYYGAYAFVEYEKNGQIVREVSAERTLAGNFDPAFVSHESDIFCTTLHDRWDFIVTDGYKTPIERGDRTVYTDKHGEAFSIYYTADVIATKGRIGSVKFKVKTPLSKNTLQELVNCGRTLFTFYVCYRTVDESGVDKRYTGDIYSIDMSAMDETCIANAAKINDRMACDTAVSVAQSNEWSAIYRSKLVKTSIESNCWYMVQYDVNKLIEFYDVFFDPNSQWALFGFGINGGANGVQDAELYISNFTFDKPFADNDIEFANAEELPDELPDTYTYSLIQNGRWQGNDANWDYETTVKKPTYNAEGGVNNLNKVDARYKLIGEYSDVMYKNKEVAQAYAMYKQNNAHNILVGASLTDVTKDTLQALIDAGYGSLKFSFVYNTETARNSGYYMLDLAKVKADPTLTIRNADGYINHDVFVMEKNPDNAAASKWVTIEYMLEDLLTCYDRLFANEPYWTLAIPFGTVDTIGYFYMTELSFEEAVEQEPEVSPLDDLTNVLPNLNSWALMQNGRYRASSTILDYTPNVSELGYSDSYVINNLSGDNKRYQLVGEKQTNLTYKGKEVMHAYPMYANNNMHPILVGGKLGSITKANLQTLQTQGYETLTFSFVHTTYEFGARNSGYFLLDLAKVKADSTLKIRHTENVYDTDGTTLLHAKDTVNLNAFTEVKNTSNNSANNWVTVEYAVEDLIACYDQLFAGETYWTLVIPYGTIGANLTEAGTVCGYFYMSKMSFEKGVVVEEEQPAPNPITDPSNVCASVDSWALLQNGRWQGSDANWDYTATVTELTYSESHEINNLNKANARYKLTGKNETELTYKDKEVAQSYAMYAQNNAHSVIIGANFSGVTKAHLQELADAGYEKLTFSFVYTSYQYGARSSGYYLLDLAKLKADSTLKIRDANGFINHDVFTQTSNTSNSKASEWVTVEYAVEDLIACYDQLFADETYLTLAIPYGTIGAYLNTDGEICGYLYTTKLAFVKEQ